MIPRRLFIAFLTLTLFSAALINAQTGSAPALPKGIEKVTSVEGITEYHLGNGLKVLLFPDPSKETITVNATYLVGSRHEGYGETGMAHLLEHLLFKGSPRHQNVPKELTDHGTRPNGSTWFDRTNYFETFRATPENLDWALDLESDRMVNSFVARKDLDSEMTVVRNEFEMGENDPLEVLMDKTMAAAYEWHNYGKSTIGARADIENVPIDRLQAFYRSYYQPDNTVLIVAGKIDEAATLRLIDKYFSPIPRPTRKLYPTYTAEPTQDGERGLTLRRVGDTQAVMAAYHVPAGSHQDFAAVRILNGVLTDAPAGRLYKALVETKKAARVSGEAFQFKEPGILWVRAEVRKENSVQEARDILLKTVDELATKSPATQEEVERIRTQSLKQFELLFNSSERVALNLSEWEGMGDWRLLFLNRDRIRKVTVNDVNRAAATYLKPSNRTVGLFIPDEKPERAEIPATPDVPALLKGYQGEAAVAQGEAFDPSPANIDARTRRGQIGDGLKLAFVAKKTRANTVNLVLSLHFGDEKNLMNRGSVPMLTGQMLMRGTRRLTRQQIKDEFDKLKAQVGINGGPTSATATIQATRENLPAVLTLVAEVLKEPSFPDSEFDQLKQQILVQIESQRREPMAIGSLTMNRHLVPFPKGDVRYVPTMDERVEQINSATLDDVKKFHAEFYGASKSELAVVGDFDPAELQKLAAGLFGDWKSKASYKRVERPYQKIAPLNQPLETPDKANAAFFAGLPVNLSDEDPDYPALVLGDYILGGGFLNSRLATRIRQKEGLSYGVGSMFQAAAKDKGGVFMAYAICAPQNVPKLEVAFKEEVARALKDGFTEDEVKAAKEGWLQSRQVSRSQDRELASHIVGQRFWDRSMAFDADLEQKVRALTPAQILEAFRRHIKLEDLSIVKAGDFKKANVTF
ncbi:MAG: pitrilysin family protein [Bryobacteraceae bacterium]|jgi:zinc protease